MYVGHSRSPRMCQKQSFLCVSHLISHIFFKNLLSCLLCHPTGSLTLGSGDIKHCHLPFSTNTLDIKLSWWVNFELGEIQISPMNETFWGNSYTDQIDRIFRFQVFRCFFRSYYEPTPFQWLPGCCFSHFHGSEEAGFQDYCRLRRERVVIEQVKALQSAWYTVPRFNCSWIYASQMIASFWLISEVLRMLILTILVSVLLVFSEECILDVFTLPLY